MKTKADQGSTVLASCLLVLLLLVASSGMAHGPFDHSSRLIVGETQLELVVTMGADAAGAFLSGVGHSSAGSQTLQVLPTEVAAKLFELSVGGKPLVGGEVRTRTEGLETLFTVIFPHPGHGGLNVRAIYFNGIEPMKVGAFIAHDESMRQLGAALLSRANDAIQITLPEKAGEAEANSMQLATPPGTPAKPLLPDQIPDPISQSDPKQSVGGQSTPIIWLAALGLGIIGIIWFRRSRRASSP